MCAHGKNHFSGAAGTVTGSKYLVEAEANGCWWIAACSKAPRNCAAKLGRLSIDPATIDWVLLTHAHIDHTGYFRAWCAMAFADPSTRMPPRTNSARCCFPIPRTFRKKTRGIAAKKRLLSHKPPLPLYTVQESQHGAAAVSRNSRADHSRSAQNFRCVRTMPGHILGSTWLELTITENGKQTLVVFSGDVGPLQPADSERPGIAHARGLSALRIHVRRSRPSGRLHPPTNLADVINRTAKRGGAIVIPAFAVDRTQLLMYYFAIAR